MSDGTMNAALRSLGYPSNVVTAHGFRATARTLIAEVLSIDPAVVELQLAHQVKDANGSAYNRTEFIEKRRVMSRRGRTIWMRSGRAEQTCAAMLRFRSFGQ